MTTTPEQIAAGLAELDAFLEQLPRCSDGYCIIRKHPGMHTNGGCRCSSDKVLMQRFAHAHNRFSEAVRTIIKDQPNDQ